MMKIEDGHGDSLDALDVDRVHLSIYWDWQSELFITYISDEFSSKREELEIIPCDIASAYAEIFLI
jgi:hypothetical protein